jgi:hypothetical protein
MHNNTYPLKNNNATTISFIKILSNFLSILVECYIYIYIYIVMEIQLSKFCMCDGYSFKMSLQINENTLLDSYVIVTFFAFFNHYYKMWVKFINPCSLNQWIHSKFITWCTRTPFVSPRSLNQWIHSKSSVKSLGVQGHLLLVPVH